VKLKKTGPKTLVGLLVAAGIAVAIGYWHAPIAHGLSTLWPKAAVAPKKPSIWDLVLDVPVVVFLLRLLSAFASVVVVTGMIYVFLSFCVRIRRGQYLSKFLWIEMSPEALEEHRQLQEAKPEMESLTAQLEESQQTVIALSLALQRLIPDESN
jgi:hypothetical protein